MTALFRTPKIDPRQVPRVPFEVDRSHQLGRGMSILFIPALSGHNYTGLWGDMLPNTAPVRTNIAKGPSVDFRATNSSYSSAQGTLPAAMQIGPTTGCTLHWTGQITTGSGSRGAMYFGAFRATFPTYFYTLGISSGNAGRLTFNFGNGGTADFPAFTPTSPFPQSASVGWAGSTSVDTYFNGALFGTVTIGASPIFTYGTDSYTSMGPTGALFGDGYTTACFAWTHYKQAADMAWLDREPFCMLRPIVRRTYLLPIISSDVVQPPQIEAMMMV